VFSGSSNNRLPQLRIEKEGDKDRYCPTGVAAERQVAGRLFFFGWTDEC
jgi:hypothetical protein